MKYKAIISPTTAECCLVATGNGRTVRTPLDGISQLVNHCGENNIPLLISDIIVSDDFTL